jgi:hypothetical protein
MYTNIKFVNDYLEVIVDSVKYKFENEETAPQLLYVEKLYSRCGINNGLIKRGSTTDLKVRGARASFYGPLLIHTYIHCAEQNF